MSPKARPAFSAKLSRKRRSRAPNFSKPFPNFLQIFGGFLQAFPNFCLAVLGNIRGLKGKKFGDRAFRASPNFCPPPRGKLSRKQPLPPPGRTEAEVLTCQTAEMHFATDCEKQKAICGFSFAAFVVGGTAADPRADAGGVFGDGSRENGRLFAAAMTTAKRVRPERCRFGRRAATRLGSWKMTATSVFSFHFATYYWISTL